LIAGPYRVSGSGVRRPRGGGRSNGSGVLPGTIINIRRDAGADPTRVQAQKNSRDQIDRTGYNFAAIGKAGK